MFYLRDPKLDDNENLLLHKPYCGNPFIAPGTIGSKTRGRFGAGPHDFVEGLADEVAFLNEANVGADPNEETIMPSAVTK